MAFAETRGERRVLEGECPVTVTLEEAVYAGDPIALISTGWGPAADGTAATEVPVLIAGENGEIGDEITAYMLAVVEAKTAAASQATLGEKVCVNDSGEYIAATAEMPDVGFVVKTTGTSLLAGVAILILQPSAHYLTAKRA